MTRKILTGAWFALTAAAVIAGCNKKDSNSGPFTTATGVDLFGQHDFPATAIAENNKAPDGGGFSHNGQDLAQLACQFNRSCTANVSSQGGATSQSSADGSAIIA